MRPHSSQHCNPRQDGFLDHARDGIKAHTSDHDMQKNSIEVGKYLVSPFIKTNADGGYLANVSIRSGQGMASHDRVLRFSPSFKHSSEALAYATRAGLDWIRQH